MQELTPIERQALKAKAHALDPVIFIGDKGLTPAVMNEMAIALQAHELIKIRASADRDTRAAWMITLCAELDAAPVQHIGKMLVIYRVNPALVKVAESTVKQKTPTARALKRKRGAPEKRPPHVRIAKRKPKTSARRGEHPSRPTLNRGEKPRAATGTGRASERRAETSSAAERTTRSGRPESRTASSRPGSARPPRPRPPSRSVPARSAKKRKSDLL